jgi:uroporphyrinogen-III synthase
VLFLAGEDRHSDLEAALRRQGHTVEICVTYRAVARRELTREAREALGTGGIAAVLHYSPRSARLLLEAVKEAALLDAFSVCLHACLSSAVAKVLPARFRTAIAGSPSESDLLAALDLGLGHDSVAIAGKTDLPAITEAAGKMAFESPRDGD